MKTENTLENKAKFFALYWKQPILRDNEGIANEPWLNYGWGQIEKLHLELTPLYKITDEDAEFIKQIEGYIDLSSTKEMIIHHSEMGVVFF